MSEQQHRNGYVITWCIVVVLAFAVVLKVIAAAREWTYFSSGSAFIGKEVGLALVELAVVVLLLTSWRNRSTWATTSVLFGVFAIIQAWNVFTGQHSCDCLGVISSAPISLLMLDVSIALISLLFFFSIPKGEQQAKKWSGSVYQAVKVFGIAFFGVAAVAVLSCIMLSFRWEHRLSNNSLVTPKSIQQSSTPFTNKSIRFTELPIKNISQDPITIVGVQTTCSTRLGRELPFQIQPGEVLYLPVAAKNKREGRQVLTADVYSDGRNELRSTKVWRVEF